MISGLVAGVVEDGLLQAAESAAGLIADTESHRLQHVRHEVDPGRVMKVSLGSFFSAGVSPLPPCRGGLRCLRELCVVAAIAAPAAAARPFETSGGRLAVSEASFIASPN
jgi:hypothetical protein